MKKIYTFFLVAMITATGYATQWSVSNSPQNPGQFASIVAAVASGSVLNGDTLLVHPTATVYSTFFLSKSLVIIGGGFNENKVLPYYTQVQQIFLSAGCSGSKFYGITITSGISTSGFGPVANDLTFEDCYLPNSGSLSFTDNFYPTNLVVRNCIMGQINLGNVINSSAVFINCIFTGFGPYISQGSLVVSHCTFIATYGSSMLGNVQNAIIQDCIFYNSGFQGFYLAPPSNCSFTNCMSFNGNPNTLPPAGNSGANNQSNVNPNFVNNPINTGFEFTRDYHLQAGSPALTAAADGGQIGVYGGGSTFSLTGEPLNSAITRYFNINNSVVPVNGNLNINLMVTKPIGQ